MKITIAGSGSRTVADLQHLADGARVESGVFFPTLISSMAGVHGIPETHFEVAPSYKRVVSSASCRTPCATEEHAYEA